MKHQVWKLSFWKYMRMWPPRSVMEGSLTGWFFLKPSPFLARRVRKPLKHHFPKKGLNHEWESSQSPGKAGKRMYAYEETVLVDGIMIESS